MHEITNLKCEVCGKPRQGNNYHGLVVCKHNGDVMDKKIELDYQPKTQNELLLNHLRMTGSITMFEAFTKLGIAHLPRRIKDLKEKGISINCDEWIHVTKANGKSATVKKYILDEL